MLESDINFKFSDTKVSPSNMFQDNTLSHLKQDQQLTGKALVLVWLIEVQRLTMQSVVLTENKCWKISSIGLIRFEFFMKKALKKWANCPIFIVFHIGFENRPPDFLCWSYIF